MGITRNLKILRKIPTQIQRDMTPKTIKILKTLNKLRKAGEMAMTKKDNKQIEDAATNYASEILYKQYNHLVNSNDLWD